jgi:urea transport system ATP-binding protein
MTPLIATTALRAGYATGDVLQDVSVEVGTGEVVGVLGRNGVGKSTLMRALIGLLPARNGMIVYQGNDITRQAANRRAALGIGYVPQGREVFAQMSVLDNLRMGQFIDRSRQFDPAEVYAYFPFLRERSRQRARWSLGRSCCCWTSRATACSRALCTRSAISSYVWSRSGRSVCSSWSRTSS